MSKIVTAAEHYSESGRAQRYHDYVAKEGGCVSAMLIKRMIAERFPENVRPKGGLLADFGCGPGTSFPLLVETFKFDSVIGVDVCPNMTSFIKENFKDHTTDIRLQVADIRNEQITADSDSTELVISCYTLSYLDTLDNVFKEASRILKNGRFFAFDIMSHDDNTAQDTVSYVGKSIPVLGYVHSRNKILKLAEENELHFVTDLQTGYGDEEAPVPSGVGLFFFQKKK